MKYFNQIKAVLAGVILSSSIVPVVSADDTEIYTTLPPGATISNPNIMFIVDTSIGMATESRVKPFYDASVVYPSAGGCVAAGIYMFATDSVNVVPDCSLGNYVNASALVCDHAVKGYAADGTLISPGVPGGLLSVGTYSDQVAHYDTTSNRWVEIGDVSSSTERGYIVECLSDSGIHGAANGANKYIQDANIFTGTVPANLDVPHSVWAGGAGNKQLFMGNYLNYLLWVPIDLPGDPTDQLVSLSYIDQVKAAVEVMVRGNTRVDIGLMRFDRMSSNGNAGNSEGGAVLYPIIDVGANRNDFFQRLATLDADGYSPMAETYYEALLYFGGKSTDYSNTSSPSNQITSTTEISPGVFRSPISSTCEKNYVVMLSGGSPSLDVVDATRQAVLPEFTGTCSVAATIDTIQIAGSGANTRDAYHAPDSCLDDLAEWAATEDVASVASIAAHTGKQNIVTHTIGLGLVTDAPTNTGDPVVDAANAAANAEATAARSLLNATAIKGDGTFYTASDQQSLVSVFNNIVNAALETDSTFSSPAVSVNAFNRSTHLDDLYFTLFKPSVGNHWDGNLKKYKLKFDINRVPFIADSLNAHAIDPITGFFSDESKSFWTPGGTADGKDVSAGGAISVFPASRNVYTFAGTYAASGGVNTPSETDLTAAANLMDTATTGLDSLISIPADPVIVTGKTNFETVVNWARGLDALSQHGDLDTFADVRPQMGDPLHAEPALVQYGRTTTTATDGTSTTVDDLVAYAATNDGYLHAFDVNTGIEIFSFIPQELLPALPRVMLDRGGNKSYGLDGSVVAWITDNPDNNGDLGTINTAENDRVIIYVSMRRGGRNIYALDVTTPETPVFLWMIEGGTGNYTELGQTWSTINVEKVMDGTTEKTVLIFGGGYDPDQDTATLTTVDDVGRTVYIADAETGQRLWSAGADASGTATPNMNYSIPARIKPLDISGDGYIDRLYAVDMGGQMFRFDINNTSGALSASIIGGRIADLADASTAAGSETEANARRFYYPPDIALVDASDGPYHGLILSSGFRAHPLNDAIHDKIYMIKDRNTAVITAVADYNYNAAANGPMTENDLQDATANLAGGEGNTDVNREAALANITAAEGWYIDLNDENNANAWMGEKGLSESLIIEGVAIVTTYTPNLVYDPNSCEPNIGTGKVFYLDILDATPAYPANVDGRSDRYVELTRGGIPPTPNVIITDGGVPTICTGTNCTEADFGLGVRKTYWYEVN